MIMNKVVRSYGPCSCGQEKSLKEAFADGWKFERASEYIPGKGEAAGYIEYILWKEVTTDED